MIIESIANERLFAEQALTGSSIATRILNHNGVARDSRTVAPGQVYVAMGDATQLVAHVAQARAAGASVVVAESPLPGGPSLVTPHARWSFARASAAAYGVDRDCPPLFGATGTKGKSTTVHCAWWALGTGAARVGTIGWHDGREERPNRQTTPPPDELHDFLRSLSSGCQGVALEVSSHGADQHRLAGLRLRALAWTGLGHDHLEYHGSPESYLTAKLRCMRWLEEGGSCVINADDATGYVAVHAARAAGACAIALGFGEAPIRAHLDARILRDGPHGYRLALHGTEHVLPSRLPGDFNAWNTAAGALMAAAGGVPIELALERLATMPPVPGRMELLALGPATYVDYAHTPESITVALAAVRSAHPGRRIAIVFGCGGDRDPSKRAPMGRAAAAADVVVITTDNSRSEAPEAIARDILKGIPNPANAVVELDRGPAIVRARDLAGPEGVVLVAGKGHETTQDIRGTVAPWDDRAYVLALAGRTAPQKRA